MLIQDGHPVTFVSQALTETQKHYSNIKMELLAVVIIVERLHHYVFGCTGLYIHTDHSPLVSLFQKCLNDTSPWLQCLLLHLSQYQMDVQYVTHKCVPIANCMSRLTNLKTGIDDPSLSLQIADVTVTNSDSIDWNQIKRGYLNDPTMVKLAQVIQKGWPQTSRELCDDIKPYFPHRFALHIVDGIILLHDRKVAPVGLRQTFLRKIHDAHLGIVKSKLLGRTLIYWPNWNADVEKTCQTCDLCRENQNMPANVPKFEVTVSHPGKILWCGHHGDPRQISSSSGQLSLLLYFWTWQLSSLHTTEIIKALKSIFCNIGAPDKLISDNAKILYIWRISRVHDDMVHTTYNVISSIPSWQCTCWKGCAHHQTNIC